MLTVGFGTDLPVVKPLTAMPGILGGADQEQTHCLLRTRLS